MRGESNNDKPMKVPRFHNTFIPLLLSVAYICALGAFLGVMGGNLWPALGHRAVISTTTLIRIWAVGGAITLLPFSLLAVSLRYSSDTLREKFNDYFVFGALYTTLAFTLLSGLVGAAIFGLTAPEILRYGYIAPWASAGIVFAGLAAALLTLSAIIYIGDFFYRVSKGEVSFPSSLQKRPNDLCFAHKVTATAPALWISSDTQESIPLPSGSYILVQNPESVQNAVLYDRKKNTYLL